MSKRFGIQPKRTMSAADERAELRRLAMEAQREWQLAVRYFHSVHDPELVDHAAYLIKATERRYAYLLKCARQIDRDSSAEPGPNSKT